MEELKAIYLTPPVVDGLEILGEISKEYADQHTTHDKVVLGLFKILLDHGIRVYIGDKAVGDMTPEQVEEVCKKYHLSVFMKDGRPLGFIDERRTV